MMVTPTGFLLALPVLVVGLAACSGACYEEMLLCKAATRGAETHTFLNAQEATIDKTRCTRAYDGSDVISQTSSGRSDGRRSPERIGQAAEFFVGSCALPS
ncbi:hypothetical protein AB0M50_11760 [Nonomuraea fuscirosea]|uniref:hypothetical protein n=1 Tax=Nonomuraea fuscirosea TaxID=1291556 RepID=UPI00342CBDFF